MIPSYNWKVIDGWSNYSGMVISHKMIEREMDDRGSKSKLSLNRPTSHKHKLNFVKEQRVDGSWHNFIVFKVYSNGFRKKLSSQNPF